MDIPSSQAERFFYRISLRPKTYLITGLAFILLCASFFLQLRIDPRAESFLPDDSPALLYRNKVEKTFGLNDPMVIAIKSNHPNGVFNASTLALVEQLTDQLEAMPELDSERLVSLATQDAVYGNSEGMVVSPFFEHAPTDKESIQAVRKRVMDFPLYVGSLVSRDESMTLIVTELLNEDDAPAVYEQLLELSENSSLKDFEQVYVAGDGAVSGYLVSYINADAARLVPISVIIITLLCIAAFRTLQGVVLPTLVIVASTTSAIGVMAAMGDPIYVITTSMPILLVGIAVADSIHILSEYYEQQKQHPNWSQQQLVVRALSRMWRPVLLTTLTSMIGFLGVYASSYMPPMQSFGLYSMLGLAVAGIFSLIVVPATQMLFIKKNSPMFSPSNNEEKHDYFSTLMASLGNRVLKHTKVVLSLAALIITFGIWGALQLDVNESWIDNFRSTEKISLADSAINQAMDGSNNLDIVIETSNNEDLFKPENLKRIEALQAFLETQSGVGGTTSIVDYLKQMHRSLNENKNDFYTLPNDETLISQYFLLYSANGDPAEFEEEIDYDYRLALIRAQLNSGRYQDFKPVVENVQHYIDTQFNNEHIKASLSGRIYVDYEWLNNLLGSHYKGVLFALALVWLLACLSFRSIQMGSLALVPVLLSTLAIYAFMGFTGITLAVGTTMTAAIGLGIGIDFSIHTLDRIKLLIKEQGIQPDKALAMIYPSTGRALLFNFFAVFVGFGVLGLSHVPPLSKLGILIAFAVLVSFISSMTVLPALVKLLKPSHLGFIQIANKKHTASENEKPLTTGAK
ncbi:RND family transporter [Agaribacterium sp. ZY112]|uniref:efflux RND transporter permease subunit n=1 Tax=Agaribacterium sp. ZY112 TaxID=3233574 RepID=UPI003526B918